MSNYVVRIFRDVSMANNHDGLQVVAMKQKVNFKTLGKGEHVVFLNKALNRFKVYSSPGVVSYYKAPSGKLNMEMIQFLPLCFGQEGFDFKKADLMGLEKALARKVKTPEPTISKKSYVDEIRA